MPFDERKGSLWATWQQPFENETNHPHIMRVRKRDGTLDAVDVTKSWNESQTAVKVWRRWIHFKYLQQKRSVDFTMEPQPKELDNLCIQTSSLLIGEDPEYFVWRPSLSIYMDEEVRSQKNSILCWLYHNGISKWVDRGVHLSICTKP